MVLEFAINIVAIVAVALVVAQLGLYLTEGQRFVQASFEACRYAAIAPEQPTEAQVRTHVEHVLDEMGMDATGLQLSVDYWIDGDEEIVTVDMALPVAAMFSPIDLPATYEQNFVAVVTRGMP